MAWSKLDQPSLYKLREGEKNMSASQKGRVVVVTFIDPKTASHSAWQQDGFS